MKKDIVRLRVLLAVALAVYHVVIFALPFQKNGVFFISWIFTLIAIGAQVYVVRTAFYSGESAKSKFYGFPIVRTGAAYDYIPENLFGVQPSGGADTDDASDDCL